MADTAERAFIDVVLVRARKAGVYDHWPTVAPKVAERVAEIAYAYMRERQGRVRIGRLADEARAVASDFAGSVRRLLGRT